MKKFVFIALSLLFSSCSSETLDISRKYDIPKDLNDCSFYLMRNNEGGAITVVRCPNSSTSTTTSGKYSRTVSTVEVPKDTLQEQIENIEKQLSELKRKKD